MKCTNCSRSARPDRKTCEKCAETAKRCRRAYYYKNLDKCRNDSNGARAVKYANDPAWRETVKAAARAYNKAKPEIRRARQLARYGLTLAEYDSMKESQSGACKICGCAPKVLVVDHRHDVSAKVRGLLCDTCNRALGLFKDSPDLLLEAAKYLAKSA